jgi:hypothetical protein
MGEKEPVYVWLVWNDSDYYGPDPAEWPWIFISEELAKARAFELRGVQRPESLLAVDDPWPYRWERVEIIRLGSGCCRG